MEDFIFSALSFFPQLFTAVQESTLFFIFKILAAIYTAVLLVDVILLVYLGDVRKRYRQLRRGSGSLSVSQRAITKSWKEIRAHLEGEDVDQWKAAVLQAHVLIDKELAAQGYHGENFSERLAQIPPHAFTDIDKVHEAHAMRNRIIRDEDYDIEHEDAVKVVDTLAKFLDDLGVGMV